MRTRRPTRWIAFATPALLVTIVAVLLMPTSVAAPITVPEDRMTGLSTGQAGGPVAMTGGVPTASHEPAYYPPRAPSAGAAGAGSASPGCSSSCPMGITDYGVNSTGATYTWTAATVGAWADISTLSVGTSTGGCFDPHAKYCAGLQENSIATGVMVNNNKGTYWTQDVVQVAYDGSSCSSPCVKGTYSVTWIDNIWNFTKYPSTMNPATLTGNGTGSCSSYGVGSGGGQSWYYCIGPTDYDLTLPFTIWTMTNLGPNANKFYGSCPFYTSNSCIEFWGAIFEGSSEPYYGWFDLVSFHAGSKGAGKPLFKVADTNTPYGLPEDAEWDLCGPYNGGYVNLTAANILMQSEYDTGVGSGGTSEGKWINVPNAWSSGDDTAEWATDANLWNYFGNRYLALATYGTADPQTFLW